MELEIKSIIEKNLPAQVGDVLKQRLDQADKDAARVKQLEETLGNRDQEITSLNNKIQEYKKFDERNAALEAREKAASDMELKLELETVKFKLAAEKDKTDFTKQVALGLVRNLDYRKVIFDSQNQSGYSHGNDWIQPSPINKHLDETRTAS